MVQKAVANPARLSYQGEALFSISFPLFLVPVSFRFYGSGFVSFFTASVSFPFFTVPVSFCFYGSGFVSLSAAPDVIVLP